MLQNNKKIIKVTPVDNWFNITWELGNRCNQTCCYCPPEVHSDNGKLYTLDELKNFWLDIFNKTKHLGLKYKISFTGGEATIQKNFLPFLQWLRDNYNEHIGKLLLTSNGTASKNYYLKILELIDNLSLSVHSEYIDEKKYFTKLIEINKSLPAGKVLHINVMNEPWNQERIPYYEQTLKDNNIYYSVNLIFYPKGITEFVPVFKGNLNFDLSRPYKL